MATSSSPSLYAPYGSTAYTTTTPNPTQNADPNSTFAFPTYTTFPPFYTLQPNLTTRARQLELWSSLITTYSAYHRLFRLSLTSPPPNLFSNAAINRSLNPTSIRQVLDHMSAPANGSRIEYIPPTTKGEQSNACYVWWRPPGEWADLLYAWVEETGQKGSVLTIYELRESEAVEKKEWRDMDEGMLRKVLGVLVKRGKAQVFGQAEGEGVKFF
jgi:ESCRT-II complex subunit VPS25